MRNKSDRLRLNILQSFDNLWYDLFKPSHQTQHLDTLLSKQPKNFKKILAKLIVPILMKPLSLCQKFNIYIPDNKSPLNMEYNKLAEWKTSREIAAALYDELQKDPKLYIPGFLPGDYPDIILEEFDNLQLSLQARSGNKNNREVLSVLAEMPPLSLRINRKYNEDTLIPRLEKQINAVFHEDEQKLEKLLTEKEKKNDYFAYMRRKERYEKRHHFDTYEKDLEEDIIQGNDLDVDLNEEIEDVENEIPNFINKKKIRDIPKIEYSKLVSNCIILPNGHSPVARTNLWKEGAFEIQDEASAVMANFACFPEEYYPLLSGQPSTASPIDRFLKRRLMENSKNQIPDLNTNNNSSKILKYMGTWGGMYPKTKFEDTITKVPELPSDPAALTIVDACAGAGGKTLALADNLNGRGRVYAYDISEYKLKELQKRQVRANLTNIQRTFLPLERETLSSGMKGLPESLNKFKSRADIVLVDSPCSGWGVLRRNPDMKWRLQHKETLDAIHNLPNVQLSLMDAYSKLVRPGGRLVYGVCTLRAVETINIIERFLENNPAFDPMGGGFLGPLPSSADAFFMYALHRKDKSAMALMNSELQKLKLSNKIKL